MLTSVLYVWILLVITFAFQLWPNYCHILYLNHLRRPDENVREGACTKPAEWLWIVGMGSFIVLIPSVIVQRQRKKDLEKVTSRTTGTVNHNPNTKRCWSIRTVWKYSRYHHLVVFVMLNCILFLAALYRPYRTIMKGESWTWQKILSLLGAKAAWPAYWNMLFGLVPIQRISFLRQALGMSSHVESVSYHIWAGYAVFVWLLVHTTFLSIAYVMRYPSWSEWKQVMFPYQHYYTEGVVNFMGWMGFFGLVGLIVTSLPSVRNYWHEGFLVCHYMFSILFVLFSNLHDYNTLQFVLPALMTIIAEQILRQTSTSLRTCLVSPTAMPIHTNINEKGAKGVLTTTLWTQQENTNKVVIPILGLTVSIPSSWKPSSLVPGSFVYLKVPSISQFQSHPFTISRIDINHQTISLHIKSLGNWTSQLLEKCQHHHILLSSSSNDEPLTEEHHLNNNNTTRCFPIPFNIELEGPYGDDLRSRLTDYTSCLLIVGGIGITAVSEALAQLSSNNNGNNSTLIWLVRTVEEMQFLTQELLLRIPTSTVKIRIFITSPSSNQVDPLLLLSEEQLSSQHPWETKSFHWKSSSNHVVVSSFLLPKESFILAAFASIFGVALSFFLARLTCCYQYGKSDETGIWVSKCSLFGSTQSYRSCTVTQILMEQHQQKHSTTTNNNTDVDLPCKTVYVCYYCFRGLTVILCFFVAPIIALCFYNMVTLVKKMLRYLLALHHGFSYIDNGLLAVVDEEDSIHPQQQQIPTSGSSNNNTVDYSNDGCCWTTNESSDHTNNIQVEYRRPILRDVLQEFYDEDTNRDDSPMNEEFQDEEEVNNVPTSAAAIVVCGSQPLIQSVSKDVSLFQKEQQEYKMKKKTLHLMILNPFG